MGLATSEIAANTIPCCCDNQNDNANDEEARNPYQQQPKPDDGNDDDFDSKSDDFNVGNDSNDNDEFMEDPYNTNTLNVIDTMNPDFLNYEEGDLWRTLDKIFESYQPQELIDSIKDSTYGLKHGLQTILDDFTQNALFQSVVNTLNHRKKPFNITKTMAIDNHEKSQYQTQPLWFYDDREYGIVSNKHEDDACCRYKCIDGNKYSDNNKMECDNPRLHHNYPDPDKNKDNNNYDKCLLQLQYLSCGNILDTKYYKTKKNYNNKDNEWCFKYEKEKQNYIDMDDDCRQIAFGSFGQHYTSIYQNKQNKYNQNSYKKKDDFTQRKIQFLSSVRYINDVSFLKKYAVRDGYNQYGAMAYFNGNYECIAIQTYWDNRIWMKPNNLKDTGYLEQWKYAKWIWKVSIIIASHLCEWIGKCRFIEINSFIQSVQCNLSLNHPLRRLFKPFLYGSISANNHFLELVKKYGIYHRCFGFKYPAFCQLLQDSMKSYKFKILKKRFKKCSSLDEYQCPAHYDFNSFWDIIQDFVTKYIAIYYGDEPEDDKHDRALNTDKELKNFYFQIVKLLRIDQKYRFKRFNIVMLITHFICVVSIYNKHLNEAISFDGIFKAKIFYPKQAYSYQNYSGCAIRKNIPNKKLNCTENDILSFTEFMLIVLNNGNKEKTFDLERIWASVLLSKVDDPRITKCKEDARKLFKSCQRSLVSLEYLIQQKNKKRKIPYNACCVSQLQSSACL